MVYMLRETNLPVCYPMIIQFQAMGKVKESMDACGYSRLWIRFH